MYVYTKYSCLVWLATLCGWLQQPWPCGPTVSYTVLLDLWIRASWVHLVDSCVGEIRTYMYIMYVIVPLDNHLDWSTPRVCFMLYQYMWYVYYMLPTCYICTHVQILQDRVLANLENNTAARKERFMCRWSPISCLSGLSGSSLPQECN